MWSVDFPPEVIELMDLHKLSVNDLKMAGILLVWLVLECLMPTMQYIQAGLECDNSSSVHWTQTYLAKSLIAGHLLWALALRQ